MIRERSLGAVVLKQEKLKIIVSNPLAWALNLMASDSLRVDQLTYFQ